MAGGAGNIGSAGGMGNVSAQPQGGPFGGGMGGAPRQSTNQSTFGQGMNTMFGGGSPFGMQQQQPMQNPFGGQQLGPNQSPGYGMNQQQQLGPTESPGYGMNQFRQQQQQGPIRQDMSSMGQLGAANQMPEPMGQRPAFLDNPDFQAYQKQEQDLGRQMNEYMQKAPMYQQMQELQGKMRGFQQPQQGQMQNPYGDIDQMQQQRNMQDQARQQQMWQQATQDDMRAAVMPQQPGSEQVAPEVGNFGERRMGGGFGRRGMGGGYGQQMPQQAMGLQGLYSMLQGRRGGPFGGY